MIRLAIREPAPGSDAAWRAEYRKHQDEQRVATVQPDLFGAPAVETYRRDAPAKPIVSKSRYRLRPDLDPAEMAMMLASAANWLRTRQRVQIAIDSPHQHAGRQGVVWRLCSPINADRVYVYLDAAGNERTEKIAFVEVRDVEPIAE
ncbi:hypothetical protein [Sphingomonas oryzagri]